MKTHRRRAVRRRSAAPGHSPLFTGTTTTAAPLREVG
jgi:hypothetical protein